ncbi:TetR/AcrR family transcriptional regulator [Bradyrhizobium sp. Ash2021]|uniref:TetR/AcrR family transcriptional regulator n=1 Tax=Bradyrhizobium sp. Ash2021 TaxID=2954771 RepID=UPI002815C8ED|nr:TetR/AcrR family transcriptional regulator [Bradyrhizobium sp. Ash2021]WMT76338.1 TetR/AcrR family transcriptional regulator [Bradyrhizobium sp. Ash2021]WMT76457.1 TetR/AcrR family transcriptional regulator [Bradyrhizobium sp. Ash2021]
MKWSNRLPSQSEVYNLKKIEIVRAAARFFSRFGYHGTTLADVAVDLGVTKQALYYYYSDKQSLLFACAIAAHRGALDILEEASAQKLSGSEKLANLLRHYAIHVADGNLQSIMFLDSSALKPKQLAEVMDLRDKFDIGIRKIVEEGVADQSLRNGDPKMMSFSALGAVNWISRWYKPEGSLPIGEAAATIVDFVMGGIAAPLSGKRSERLIKGHADSKRPNSSKGP